MLVIRVCKVQRILNKCINNILALIVNKINSWIIEDEYMYFVKHKLWV